MVYMGFKAGTWGGWPNPASEKLEALRVIDKVVYTWYPRDSLETKRVGQSCGPWDSSCWHIVKNHAKPAKTV